MTVVAATGPALPEVLPRPVPSPDGLDVAFWEGLQRHELVVQHCGSCKKFQHAPEFICFRCLSTDLEWKSIEPIGRIYSWQRVWHPIPAELAPACPYVAVLIEIPHADNIRLVGNLLGDQTAPCEIGTEVRGVFEDHDGFTLLQWERISA